GLGLAWFARRRGFVVVEAIVALLMLFPVMGLRVATAKSSVTPIRMASYNVYFGKFGRRALVDEISTMASNADIVVVQAAFTELGERLKLQLPAWNVHQQQELIVLSRWPLHRTEAPPPVAAETPAMFMKVVVDTPAGPLRVYDVHPYSARDALFDGDDTRDN